MHRVPQRHSNWNLRNRRYHTGWPFFDRMGAISVIPIIHWVWLKQTDQITNDVTTGGWLLYSNPFRTTCNYITNIYIIPWMFFSGALGSYSVEIIFNELIWCYQLLQRFHLWSGLKRLRVSAKEPLSWHCNSASRGCDGLDTDRTPEPIQEKLRTKLRRGAEWFTVLSGNSATGWIISLGWPRPRRWHVYSSLRLDSVRFRFSGQPYTTDGDKMARRLLCFALCLRLKHMHTVVKRSFYYPAVMCICTFSPISIFRTLSSKLNSQWIMTK